ncbi:hypothetical protein [Halorubrum vacuolatum]|uniref:PH domain-containing protein n=1 Tax=Halorubrum vacuolatum TaxID=63740 RepID=A0A238URE2_HALVU|nr:hypothetical protein [Halorubrum vacuolatum]SNR24531.1 hypothetical protein SAMN06264855_101273 [Halorubrum vacuolatum]
MPSETESATTEPVTAMTESVTTSAEATRAADGPGAAIEWGPVRYDRIRSLITGMALTVLFGLLAVLGLAVGAFVPALGSGSLTFGAEWALLILFLIGGPFSLIYLLIVADRASSEKRRRLIAEFGYAPKQVTRNLRPGWTLAGAGALLGIWLAGLPWLTGSLWLLFPLILFAPAMAGFRGATYRLDPADRTVERRNVKTDRTRTEDLDAVVRTRRIDLPWTTVFLLAFRGNEWYRSTPWLFVPTDRADMVEGALKSALARSDGPDRASVPERVVLALVGASTLVVGLAIALATGESGGWALAVLASPMSLVFFALAARL